MVLGSAMARLIKASAQANPGALPGSDGDHDASWKASASDNWSFLFFFFFYTYWQIKL